MLMTLVSMWLLHYFLPVYRYISEPLTYAGAAFVLAGIIIAAVSADTFKRAGTGIVPFEEATVLEKTDSTVTRATRCTWVCF